MKILKKIKVRTKLIWAFLLGALFIAIVGGISIYSIKSLSTNSSNMYTIGMQSVFWSENIKENVSEIEKDILQLIYIKDDSKKSTLQKEVNTDISEITSNIASLKTLQMNGASSNIYSNENKFIDLTNQTVKLLDDNDYEGAINKYKEIVEISTDLVTSLDKEVDNNLSTTKSVSQGNDTLVATDTMLILVILFVGVAIAIGLGLLVGRDINKPLMKMKEFAERLAGFDFTEGVSITRGDEFAETAIALNTVQKNIKELISIIVYDSKEISSISEQLSDTVGQLSIQSGDVNSAVGEISNGIQETSASSEEITASIQEVDSSINLLSGKAMDGSDNASKSISRVENVKSKVKISIEESKNVYEKQKEKIMKSIEAGKVVEKISVMADTIASIAEQTNLLALNAAIEAARAGEQGKGFTVVAEEVRTLAEQSAEAVTSIQDTIQKVQDAFKNLSEDSNKILDFVNVDVHSQFKAFEDTVDKYYEDADFMSKMSEEIASMSEELTATINQVTLAVGNMSQTAQKSSENAETIKVSVNDTTKTIGSVSETADRQKGLAKKLQETVMKFKI